MGFAGHRIAFVIGGLIVACGASSQRVRSSAPEPSRTHVPPTALRLDMPDVVDDLGPAEPVVAPDPAAGRRAVTFDDGGPDRLFGSRGDGRKRPSAPGSGGTLRLAIDTPYQLFGRSSSYLHVVAWQKDGRPVADARVFVGRRAVGRTNADGTLVFRHRGVDDAEDPEQRTLFVIDGKGRCGAAEFTPFRRTESFASDQLYVYTDRGVYRPGETVHVRVIGWRLEADYVPITGGEVELALRDRDGHSIAAATIETDDFGTGDVDLAVPLTADEGDYDLVIAYGTARESTDLQIRRFESPQLRIDHTIPRYVTRDRDTLAFTVEAQPVTGGALGKANVAVELHAGAHVTKLARDVTGKGPHAFTVSAAELDALREATKDGATIRAAITVRDARGRQDSALRSIVVASNPYVAVLEPDKDAYGTGDEVVVVARVSDRDDVAARGRPVKLVRNGKTEHTATTDEHGLATFRFTMPGRTQLIALFLADVEAPIVTSEVPWHDRAAMTTSTDAPVVRERTAVKLTARFPRGHEPVDRRVHVDLTDTSGAIVSSTILRARKERDGWVATGEIQAPTWGSSLFTFFALGRGELDARERADAAHREPTRSTLGLLVAGQEIAVEPDRELEIELHDVPDRAAPGDALDIAATVRDRRGNPVEFAASAALVDSAVLALNDPLEVTPMDRFYDPDLRTLASTGAQMLTWPVVSRNWGDHRWDVALPPFPFLGPGEPDSCRDHWDDEDVRVHEATVSGSGSGFVSGYGASGSGQGGGGTAEGTIGLGSVGVIGRGAAAGAPTITVRKRFGDTSSWDAEIRGNGRARVSTTLPDAIGEQEIVVVASDRRGGVGVARKRIAVDQPLFVEADLPDVWIAGESLDIPLVVHNRTASDADVALSLQSGPKRVRRTSLAVGKGDLGGTTLRLDGQDIGTHRIVVEATDGRSQTDRVLRDVRVVPAGAPIVTRQRAIAKRDAPASFSIEGRPSTTAHLRIEVPSVTAAFLGIDALLSTVADDPWALASDLSSAAIVLKLADREKVKSPGLDALRQQLVAAVAMTARVQRDNGAFGFWRNGTPSPYITALVLDGLLDAREAGVKVPQTTIERAAAFIGAQLPEGELASLSDIGWWEGDDAVTRRAIESEIFAVLARLEPKETKGLTAPLARMLARALATIRTSQDVRALASATIALGRLGALDGRTAKGVAERLIAARDHGHWEPTWFSAWGGTIEATAAALQMLALASDTDFADAKRDGLRWLLATRDAWGTWHNERGTVAALRAIAAVAAPRIEGTSHLVVRAGDEVIARATIDAEDPLAGARSLAHVDLAIAAVAGKHAISVEVDGPIAPSVTLVESRWEAGAPGRASRRGLTVAATGKPRLSAGEVTRLAIEAKGRNLGGATIRIAHSGLVDVDIGALAEQIGRGGVVAELQPRAGALEIRLAPDVRATELQVPVVARRKGSGRWPAISVESVPLGGAVPTIVIVDPGALVVE